MGEAPDDVVRDPTGPVQESDLSKDSAPSGGKMPLEPLRKRLYGRVKRF
jgi:hypothetical protein